MPSAKCQVPSAKSLDAGTQEAGKRQVGLHFWSRSFLVLCHSGIRRSIVRKMSKLLVFAWLFKVLSNTLEVQSVRKASSKMWASKIVIDALQSRQTPGPYLVYLCSEYWSATRWQKALTLILFPRREHMDHFQIRKWSALRHWSFDASHSNTGHWQIDDLQHKLRDE